MPQDMGRAYTGYLESDALTGNVELHVKKSALHFAALLDQYVVPYGDVRSIGRTGGKVTLHTYTRSLYITLDDLEADLFYKRLLTKFNAMVVRALCAHEKPTCDTYCDYHYKDGHREASGQAAVQVVGGSVLLLPPDDGARRIPLSFITDIINTGDRLTLTLDANESYTFRGANTSIDVLDVHIRKYLEKDHVLIPAADGNPPRTLKDVRPGVSVSAARLADAAPPLLKALEDDIANSPAAGIYAFYKQHCDPAAMLFGIRANAAGDTAVHPQWFAVHKPSADGGHTVVELNFGGQPAQTLLFSYAGDKEPFLYTLSRALEAVNCRPEALWLSDRALSQPEHALSQMLLSRTPSLQSVRSNLAGCIPHTPFAVWEKDVTALL